MSVSPITVTAPPSITSLRSGSHRHPRSSTPDLTASRRCTRVEAPFSWLDSTCETPEVEGFDWSNADEGVALYVVVEKSTADDILVPLCAALGINFVPLVGISSNILIEALADRIEADGRPARIGYVADLDQGGGIMPNHVAHWMEYFNATGRLTVPVAVTRLELTLPQVEEHDLPFADTDADDRRPWGHAGRIELDALVAIAPAGTLQRIVREWAKPYRTRDLRDALAEAEAADEVVRAWDEHSADHRRRLARLDSIRRRIRWRSIQGHATPRYPITLIASIAGPE